MENPEISTAPTDEELTSAALECIRVGGPGRDGCIVSIFELLEELEAKFADQFRVSPGQRKLLNLIDSVAADPRVDLVKSYGIEFGWIGERREFADN